LRAGWIVEVKEHLAFDLVGDSLPSLREQLEPTIEDVARFCLRTIAPDALTRNWLVVGDASIEQEVVVTQARAQVQGWM
jgi:hypothetical protein